MKRYFICLANSKKLHERCIAGIEVKKSVRLGYYLVLNNNKPKWLRPVSTKQHGEVPTQEVSNISLMDIVEIEVTEECPDGYQSENILYLPHSMKVIDNIDLKDSYLNKMVDHESKDLFGCKGKAISLEDICEINHSLTLIKPENPQMHYGEDRNKHQLRCMFYHKGHQYDLPITDIDFLEKYEKEPNIVQYKSNLYFTVSLGVLFEGWHYKLIAGIVTC